MTDRSDILVWVIYGQGGKGPLSYGFIKFADRLRAMGYSVHDEYLWKYPYAIAKVLDASGYQKKAVLGYSMGANCITWISNIIKKPIDLAVAYDPSIGIPLIPAKIEPVSDKIQRCIHYRGMVGYPGMAKLEGPTVETIPTYTPHLGICYSEHLHRITLGVLADLEK